MMQSSELIRDYPWKYDIFLSYARADASTVLYIDRFIEAVRRKFRSMIGRELRLFIDQEQIAVSSRWRDSIIDALQSSALMIAIPTPEYVQSEWCVREWEFFSAQERQRSSQWALTKYETLIFPVIIGGLDVDSTYPPQVQRIIREIAERQSISLNGVPTGTTRFETLVNRLVADVIGMLEKLDMSTVENGHLSQRNPATTRIETAFVTMRYGSGSSPFVRNLAEATSVVVVDATNEHLADYIEEALQLKRQKFGKFAFWQELRIVFLHDGLLHLVKDDLATKFPSVNDAVRERKRRAGLAKRRLMSLFLRIGFAGRWSLHSHGRLMPFMGAMLVMGDGRTIIQLTAPSAHHLGVETLRYEFEDRHDRYFASAFHEIVNDSREEHEIVLVGDRTTDPDAGFQCRGARFRRGVMISGENIHDWLPAVITITWRSGIKGLVEPLLQVNTPTNSTREMGKISHVSGYINQQDCNGQSDAQGDAGLEAPQFVLNVSSAEAAVRRELRDELGVTNISQAPRLTGTIPFYYPDKENIFFYIYEVELPSTAYFSPSMHMHPWSFRQLLRIREYQALINSTKVLTDTSLSFAQREVATKIAVLNLTLHQHEAIAIRLQEHVERPNLASALAGEIEALATTRLVTHYSAGQELLVDGFAGLQYRAFFSEILPIYAEIGVPGTAQHLTAMREDAKITSAIENLKTLYDDQQIMTTLPIEI